ncbi:MAG: FKBP-type peptidyl-prolyl cis-trans isomerase [Candidatus Azobacteroides sp.]|nr:FKBP-type peptidyl-prolyl cis-trans isomerase [Candidatus Azobacteroides sp.]
MKISDDKVVSLTYDLNVGEGDERVLMESTTVERPLIFIFGMGMMLDAFEKNIKDLQKGDKFSFSLNPEEAYGLFDESHVVEIPKNIFEIDGKFDSERIVVDSTIPMMDASGNRLHGTIVEIQDNCVVMDFNHPLAGETLHFTGEIIDVHEPTAEEIAAMTDEGCGCSSCEGDCKSDCGCN